MSVNSVNADGSLTKIAGNGSTDTSVLKGDFSVVESTSTATRAYSIGDCFIMETGQLVRATSAIAINDTIAIGTNVAATSVAQLLSAKIDTSQKGANNGIAELDSSGKVPTTQLPSYVDDVVNGYLYNGAFYYDAQHTQPITPEDDKIYVDKTENKTYRWGGESYVEVGGGGVALGETSTTAYRGDRGKTAYDHSQDSGKLTTATASGFYKIASTSEGHIAGLTAVQKSDITGLGIPGSDTTYTFAGGTNKITVTPSGGTAQDVDITVSDSSKLPLAGGTMTGAGGIQFPTTGSSSLSNNWISAGGGYSTGSGKNGLKILSCEQADCVSGLGQDCGGGPYELSIITGASPNGDTRIRFLSHKAASPATYTKLAELQANGNFACTSINGFTIEKSVPSDAVFTDHMYNFSGTSFMSGNGANGTHDANAVDSSGIFYFTSNGPTQAQGWKASDNSGYLFSMYYSSTWSMQIAQDFYDNGALWIRSKTNGVWGTWTKIALGNVSISLVT